MKPDFIIIGAARAGTTSLSKYMESHPDIFISNIKEINFFSNERYWRKGYGWYESHFEGSAHKLKGEASTSYTVGPITANVPLRIFEYIPDIKLIYIVRDPIERLMSHYLHKVSRGIETRSLTEIINSEHKEPIVWQGKYIYQISKYLDYFPKDNILVLNITDLKYSPHETMNIIWRFLKVEPLSIDGNYVKPHNINTKITQKSLFGKKILTFYHNHIEQRRIPYKFKNLFTYIAEFGASEVEDVDIGEKESNYLYDFYKEDVKTLKQVYNIDTTYWKHFRQNI